jgi:hypothetical protein
MAKSVSHVRQIKTYADPFVHRFAIASATVKGISISEEVNCCLKKFYYSLTENERIEILEKSKNALYEKPYSKTKL